MNARQTSDRAGNGVAALRDIDRRFTWFAILATGITLLVRGAFADSNVAIFAGLALMIPLEIPVAGIGFRQTRFVSKLLRQFHVATRESAEKSDDGASTDRDGSARQIHDPS